MQQARTSLASRLSSPILLEIFRFIVDHDSLEGAYGGHLTRWDCHRSIAKLSLVCKSWLEPATLVLYESVALFGGDSARLFLRTLEQTPLLATRVKFLVLSVLEHREESEIDEGILKDSLDLVKVLDLCPNVRHLHVRPLHKGVRRSLMAGLAKKNLDTLVCAPRLHLSEQAWGQGLYTSTDTFITTKMRSCELEFGRGNPPPLVYDMVPLSVVPPRLQLVELRLICEMSTPTMCAILAACRRLEVLEIYVERFLSTQAFSTALKASAGTLRRLVLLCNPTYQHLIDYRERAQSGVTRVPLLTSLLPEFAQLGQLTVSATELPSPADLFASLPPKLFHLEIHSFNHAGAYVNPKSLVNVISDPRTQVGALRSLHVRNSPTSWTARHVRTLAQSCAERDIVFCFTPE